MKLEANKAALLSAVQMACNAIPNKTTLQVLYNLMLKLRGNVLEITATDLDLTIAQSLEVQGYEDGEIVINARKLLEVIRELPDFPVIIGVDEYVVTIKSESGFQCNLTGYDHSEYPSLPEVEEKHAAEISLKNLRRLHEKTAFAVSTDFTRISLTGIYWEFKKGRMQMAATDGHRLGKAWVEAETPFEEAIILPPKALSQVLNMAEDPDSAIRVKIGPANAQFSGENVTIYTKLIEGPYPNYENFIPKEFTKRLKADREDLMGVLRRVATMASTKNRLVVFGMQDGRLTLSAKNQDLGGDSEEALNVSYEGDAMEVGVNAGYLQEILRMCQSEEVLLKFTNPLGAIIVEPVGATVDYFFLVMPLRILSEPG